MSSTIPVNVKMSLKKRGQTVSLDIIIAVTLFLVVLLVFFSYVTQTDALKLPVASRESLRVTELLKSEQFQYSIVEGGEVDLAKLLLMKNLTDQELRVAFGVTQDFCIYLEDENGHLYRLDSSTLGIGMSGIRVNNTDCR